jgi:hypothetical protein
LTDARHRATPDAGRRFQSGDALMGITQSLRMMRRDDDSYRLAESSGGRIATVQRSWGALLTPGVSFNWSLQSINRTITDSCDGADATAGSPAHA